MVRFRSILAMICRWKFNPLNFSLLNQMAPEHRVFFVSSLLWFKTVLWWIFSSLLISWLLMCRFCSTFSMILSIFSDWSIRARCIFDIKISRLKTLESALCHTCWYCIINITHFFSSLRILPFFVIKFQNASNFFFIFTHFQDAITFNWINKYHNFFKLFYDLWWPLKRTQILSDPINITRVMRS